MSGSFSSAWSPLRLFHFTPLLLTVVAIVALSALALSVRTWFAQPGANHRLSAVIAPPSASATPEQVRRARLWPQLRELLNVLGNRLEQPGRERSILQGNLSRTGSTHREQVPIRLILEFPDRLRLEEQTGN